MPLVGRVEWKDKQRAQDSEVRQGYCSCPYLQEPHLPQCQNQQGQQQETPQGASNDDPDGDLPVFLLGDLKGDLQGERARAVLS